MASPATASTATLSNKLCTEFSLEVGYYLHIYSGQIDPSYDLYASAPTLYDVKYWKY